MTKHFLLHCIQTGEKSPMTWEEIRRYIFEIIKDRANNDDDLGLEFTGIAFYGLDKMTDEKVKEVLELWEYEVIKVEDKAIVVSHDMVQLKTYNFMFEVRREWFEANFLNGYNDWSNFDEFEENYNYADTLEILDSAMSYGEAKNIRRWEGTAYAQHIVYKVQEYRIEFNHDEWQVSTTFYQEDVTFLEKQELFDYALHMFPDSIGDVIKEYFTIEDMEIDVLDLKI